MLKDEDMQEELKLARMRLGKISKELREAGCTVTLVDPDLYRKYLRELAEGYNNQGRSGNSFYYPSPY